MVVLMVALPPIAGLDRLVPPGITPASSGPARVAPVVEAVPG
jgi:hypothetical protein